MEWGDAKDKMEFTKHAHGLALWVLRGGLLLIHGRPRS